jgi:hypothetical protein
LLGLNTNETTPPFTPSQLLAPRDMGAMSRDRFQLARRAFGCRPEGQPAVLVRGFRLPSACARPSRPPQPRRRSDSPASPRPHAAPSPAWPKLTASPDGTLIHSRQLAPRGRSTRRAVSNAYRALRRRPHLSKRITSSATRHPGVALRATEVAITWSAPNRRARSSTTAR